MSKPLIVVAPLLLYGLVFAARVIAKRTPSRHAVNVELSILLALYFLTTASLGVFWVANQQLPPFDWHYLFGYGTALLVGAHLAFNLRVVVRYLAKRSPEGEAPKGFAGRAAIAAGALALAFFLGMRAGRVELRAGGGTGRDASHDAIGEYHALSSHSRAGVALRAPSVTWGETSAYLDRSALPKTELPPPEPGRRELHPLDRADVSALAQAAAGITDRRGGLELRAAASSGALFPTELYVVARGIHGLAKGTYAYDPRTHALHLVRAQPLSLVAAGAERPEPDAALILTSVLRRTGQKYRDRAYRYAIADAGHALGNVIEVAADLGLAATPLPRFDESRIAEGIGADDAEEVVVAVAAIGTGATLAPAVFTPAPLDGPLALGVTSLAHAATSLRLGSAVSDEAVPLGRNEPALALLARRRSHRTFAARPLARADVVAVVGESRPAISRAVRAHLVASRVEGLEPGVYRLPGLERVRDGAFHAEAGRAALDQEAISGAPATIVLTLDRAVLAAEGARGYRHAFLEAGIRGARFYLEAEARNLGGCSVGAFYDAEAAALLGVDLAKEWPAHFFALGARE